MLSSATFFEYDYFLCSILNVFCFLAFPIGAASAQYIPSSGSCLGACGVKLGRIGHG